jgi:hypothetical protein
MSNPSEKTKDSRVHVQNVSRMMNDMILHLRGDILVMDDPQAKALFEVSAEVLNGLKKAFEDYDTKSEDAWR